MEAARDLFDAIATGDCERVEELVESEPGLLRERNQRGETPLLMAAYHRAADIVELLSQRGLNDIWEAATVGDGGALRQLLKEDPSLVSAYSVDGWTPLHLAAFFGHAEACRLLVEQGADPAAWAQNAQHNQALHAAVAGGDTATVEVLLDAGAPVNETASGYTPYAMALENRDEVLADLLRSRGGVAT